MLELTILSPHRDDAIFSLGLSLICWSRLPLRLQILNFFTVSEYAPVIAPASVSEISAIRQMEDRAALNSISLDIAITDLGLMDAPLRPGIRFDEITSPVAAQTITPEYLADLAASIMQHTQGHLLLAPLAMGQHVDHLSVFRAATLNNNANVAFYEDLPYSAWARPEKILTRVSAAEQALGAALEPVVTGKVTNAEDSKQRLCLMYASQIKKPAATQISKYARRYGGAERIWTSSTSARWRELISLPE